MHRRTLLGSLMASVTAALKGSPKESISDVYPPGYAVSGRLSNMRISTGEVFDLFILWVPENRVEALIGSKDDTWIGPIPPEPGCVLVLKAVPPGMPITD